MSSNTSNKPAKATAEQSPANQPGAGVDPGAPDKAPGRDILESMARGEEAQPGGETVGPKTDAQRWAELYPEPVVEERHRMMAAKAVGAICGGCETLFPIRYGDKRRLDGVAALAPLVAKYEGEFPEWYQKYRLEINGLMWLGGLGVVTVIEVKRVNALEEQVQERAAKYRGEGLTDAEARARALSDLGLTEGVQPMGGQEKGADTTH